MELRFYFPKDEIVAALKAEGLMSDEDEKLFQWEGMEYCFGLNLDYNPKLLFLSFGNLIDIDLPSFVKKVPVAKIVLYDCIPLEGNSHISQGLRKSSTSWQVFYRDGMLEIYVVGKKIEKIIRWYDKIRRGKVKGNWGSSCSQKKEVHSFIDAILPLVEDEDEEEDGEPDIYLGQC